MSARKPRFPGLADLTPEAESHLDRFFDYERRAGVAMCAGKRELSEQLKKWARARWELFLATRSPSPAELSPTTHTKGAPPQHDTPLITDTIN